MRVTPLLAEARPTGETIFWPNEADIAPETLRERIRTGARPHAVVPS